MIMFRRFPGFVVLAAAVLGGCSKGGTTRAEGTEEIEKRIQVEAVRQESVKRTLEVVGTLAAEDQVTISSQADGAVVKILADLGDRVRSGQVLLELDREKLEYSRDEQQAALARALARYGAADPGHRPPIEQTPEVQKAAAELEQARQAFERTDALHKRQLLPRQMLEEAQATLRSKQATYASALQNARNLAADIDASNAMLKLADRQLRDATVRAPFDGYIQKRLVSLGEFVRSQSPVMAIVRVDPLKVTAEIPEGMAPWVQSGQPVDLQVDAYPDRVFTGKVSRISPTVNAQTRAFPFEALVPNGEGVLKPGTFVKVKLTTDHVEPMLTLPYAALQYRYGVNRAFVVEGDHIVGKELKLGDRLGDRVEILGGVAANDVVAMTDVDNLADGMKVSVKGAVE
jgi:membrane fusion protein, multidrug efflux system